LLATHSQNTLLHLQGKRVSYVYNAALDAQLGLNHWQHIVNDDAGNAAVLCLYKPRQLAFSNCTPAGLQPLHNGLRNNEGHRLLPDLLSARMSAAQRFCRFVDDGNKHTQLRVDHSLA
jgi:hypothetical protein